MRWQHQPLLKRQFGFFFIEIEHCAQAFHIGHFEVVLAVLLFSGQVHIAVGALRRPLDLGGNDARAAAAWRYAQDRRSAPRYRVEHHSAGLLKIGKLGDFLTIQPDLPAKSPGA